MGFLAVRHLLSRLRQTLITLAGVGLGVAAFVTFSNIMLGFQEYLINQLVNNDAHVRVSRREEAVSRESIEKLHFPEHPTVLWRKGPSGNRNFEQIENPLTWFRLLQEDARVQAYSPQMVAGVFFWKGGTSRSGRLIGSDPQRQVRVSNVQDYMVAGDFLATGRSGNRLIAGDGLLQKLGAEVGETVLISNGKGPLTPFQVIGAFHFGVSALDDSVAYTSLADAQSVNQTPSRISDIAIRLTDVKYAREFSDQYASISPDKIQSWDQASANILSVFRMQDLIRNFISAAIMIVAAFGIYNILNILVNQKRKDIGILRSMGFDAKDIRNLFLVQGLILGVSGGILGLLLGHGISMIMGTIRMKGMVDHMIISYNPKIYITGFLVAVGAAAISSYLPARTASKLQPIDVVRSGE